jgi:hypothetical protein
MTEKWMTEKWVSGLHGWCCEALRRARGFYHDRSAVSAGANVEPVALGLLRLLREVWMASAVFGDRLQNTTFLATRAHFFVSNFFVMIASVEE